MLSRFLKNKLVASLAISLLVTLLVVGTSFFGFFDALHTQFSNSLYTYDNPSDQIVIIGIDDKSTQPEPEGFGSYRRWDRDRFTDLLTVLQAEEPKVITFDILFHTPTDAISREKLLQINEDITSLESNKERLSAYQDFAAKYSSSLDNPIDERMALKLKELDNVVLAATLHFAEDSVITPILKFRISTALGLVNNQLDETGSIRTSTPYFTVGEQVYDDIAVATVKKYLDMEQLDLPLDKDGNMLVNFFGDPLSYPMISFVDVIKGEFEPEFFKDKMVLIGVTSNREIHDEHYTPRDKTVPMPGIEYRANEIQTILDGKFLTNQGGFSRIATVLLLTTALTVAFSYLGALWSTLLGAAAIVVYILAAHFFYRRGLVLNMIYPFLTIILSYLAAWVYKYLISDKSKRQITKAFGRYVSEELVKQISKNPDMVKLGGEKRVITVFFSDLKGSTTLSENTEITAWVKQLNEYFTVMEGIIKKHGGTLDKYEGDAIMGFFNAPVTQADHVQRTYNTALDMKKTLKTLQAKWQSEGKPIIQFRLGINTGEAIVGNFGSVNRFDYTAMGDTVNTASRLESSANKTYGTSIIVAGFENHLQPDQLTGYVIREIDIVLLPGKKEPVRLYELLALAPEATPEEKALAATYAAGLKFYRARNFASAIVEFQKLPNDPPAQVMLARCQSLQNGQQIAQLDQNLVFHILNK